VVRADGRGRLHVPPAITELRFGLLRRDAKIERRPGNRVDVGTPVEDRDAPVGAENALNLGESGIVIVELVPHVREQCEIDARVVERGLGRLASNGLDRKIPDARTQDLEHLRLHVDRDHARHHSRDGQREVPSARADVGDDHLGPQREPIEHVFLRKPLSPLGIIELLRVVVMEHPFVFVHRPQCYRVLMSETSRRTLAYYEYSAERFWEATRDHDVTQNIDALLSAIDGKPPFRILDFGCGPGRDLAAFAKLGHDAVGLEGCESFARMARKTSGCEVLHQDFLSLSLPAHSFDGVFANASLFHVPSAELPRVIGELFAAIRPGGALVASNPIGHGEEGFQDGRYGCFFDYERWSTLFRNAGFTELGHYVRADRWIVIIAGSHDPRGALR
jgi:SAM-dependent methyltransferase